MKILILGTVLFVDRPEFKFLKLRTRCSNLYNLSRSKIDIDLEVDALIPIHTNSRMAYLTRKSSVCFFA